MAKQVKALKMPEQEDEALTSLLLGQFIKAKRTQSGIRMEDAAMLCNVSVATLSNIENGKGGRLESALQICRMLGVNLRVSPWDNHEE